jgi:hypothetical protein
MKIAVLNPSRSAAENQSVASLRIAAARIGHEVVPCKNSAEAESCSPDFVLALAATQPKLSDVPHYGVIHESRDRFLGNRKEFNNLLSYDGYLTISGRMERFLRDLSYGVGRQRPIGYCYPTSQRQDGSADLRSLLDRRALQIAYFGTNRDERRQGLFRMLSEASGVRIYGPKHSWTHLSKIGYGGAVDSDGQAVQERYAASGIGLCMVSGSQLREDTVSNRVFEIVSMGTIALCCDIPWIQEQFGDSVYYFDQNLDDHALVQSILKLRDLIYADPAVAIEKAGRARKIFETRFTAEIMVQNAVEYHQTISSIRTHSVKSAEQVYSPVISVVLRCRSRPIEYVERAVRSISGQTYGQFEVILVRHKALDLAPVVDTGFPRIRSFKIVDCWGGGRAASLWAGLEAVEGEYFAVLDDDDWWFSGHFESLFQPLPRARVQGFFAYSGSIVARRDGGPMDGSGYGQRELFRFGIESTESWSVVTSAYASNCFVASRDLLTPNTLISPQMETGSDSYLILSLLAGADPRFSYSATSVFDRSSPNQLNSIGHPNRHEDELTLQLRLLGRYRPRFLPGDLWTILAEFGTRWQFASPATQAVTQYWENAGGGYDPARSGVGPGSRFVDPKIGSAFICPPLQPWAYGATLFLNRPTRTSAEYILLVELIVNNGVIGVGVLNLAENDHLFRKSLTAKSGAQTVRIPIRNFAEVGRLTVQNWEAPVESSVQLLSIRLLAEPA